MPYYLQIYYELVNKIEAMVYKPNDLLPSENELVEEYGVTRVTIRNSIKKLKDEGRIRTEKGKGSYVNPPKLIQNLDKIYSLARDFNEEGHEIKSELIEVHTELCDETIGKHLQLMSNEQVIVIKILRKINDIPVVIQASYLPMNIVPGLTASDMDKCAIYNLLEDKYNIKLVKATEYFDPVIADEYSSELLKVDTGTPLFLTERITYTEGRKPIEFRRCVVRSDKFRFSVELS